MKNILEVSRAFRIDVIFALAAVAFPVLAADPVTLYQQHCAVCHGPGRLGLTGPALLPESLARLRKPEAVKTISDGRAATQMLGGTVGPSKSSTP